MASSEGLSQWCRHVKSEMIDEECLLGLVFVGSVEQFVLTRATNDQSGSSTTYQYKHRMLSRIAALCTADPNPPRSATGNVQVYIRNYSDGEGLLDGMEKAGFIRRSGVYQPQGYVILPLAEILVPDKCLARGCGMCQEFEEVGKPLFKQCGRCKRMRFCSVKVQSPSLRRVGNWT